ncbi:MAG: hypothetical protein ACAI43_09035 [Phycisphaerae bacterium]
MCLASRLVVIGVLFTASTLASAAPLFDALSTVNVATAPTLPANPPGFGAAVIGIGSGNSLTFTTNLTAGLDAASPGDEFQIGQVIFNHSLDGTTINYSVNFNYAVTITDQASATAGTVNFTGNISGTANGLADTVSSTYSNLALSSTTLTLGANTYYFGIGPNDALVTSTEGVFRLLVSNQPIPGGPAGVPLPPAAWTGLLGAAIVGVQTLRARGRATA